MVYLRTPICSFDAKSGILCPQCESKLESGAITRADVDASIKLVKLGEKNSQVDKFRLISCREADGNYVLFLHRDDIMTIRQSRQLYRLLQNEFSGKIWLVEENASDKKFLEDLFFPTKILATSSVWIPGNIKKTKVIVSGRWTPRFPIDIDQVVKIVKAIRGLDISVEFEREISSS